MQLRIPGNRIVRACLVAFAFLLILIFLVHNLAGGAQAIISNYHGPMAIISHWVLPNVISTYHGPIALVSGHHASVVSYYN